MEHRGSGIVDLDNRHIEHLRERLDLIGGKVAGSMWNGNGSQKRSLPQPRPMSWPGMRGVRSRRSASRHQRTNHSQSADLPWISLLTAQDRVCSALEPLNIGAMSMHLFFSDPMPPDEEYVL